MTIPLPPHTPDDPPICELWTIPQMLAVAAVILALAPFVIAAIPNVGP